VAVQGPGARVRLGGHRRAVLARPVLSGLAAGTLAALLAACGSGGQAGSGPADSGQAGARPSTAGTAAPSAERTPSGPQVTTVEITITGKAVSPPPGRVEVRRGATVRLVVHADRADEIHLHGYDREAEVAPGRAGVIEFVADEAGLFEVETHESGLVLTQLLVR
jgi:hypothetical protein